MRVLIIGATGGIGSALAAEAISRGARVTGLSRRADGLDITEEASVAHHLGRLEGPFDAIWVATGALDIGEHGPEKALRDIDADALAAQFALNATGPALVLKHAAALLPRRGRAVFAALSARVGSIGDNRSGGWYAYRASKAALNQIVHSAAIELARTHRHLICVALHPGTVATPFTERYLGRHPSVSPQDAARNLWSVTDALTPRHTGGFYDWTGKQVAW